MAKSKTTIDSEIRKTLPTRGKGKKSLMLDAIRDVCADEQSFLKQVVTIGLGGWTQPEQKEDEEPAEPVFQQPNPMLLNMVISRIEPPLKAIAPMVEFDFDENGTPYDKSSQVLKAMANGDLAPDVGAMFINGIQSMLKIQEVTELERMIKELEDRAKDGE